MPPPERRNALDNDIFNRQETIELMYFRHVIVLGVGGIGSWVAFTMALTGQCKNMYLVDPDIVESSNLNRTPFRLADIGQPKVAALKYLIIERRAVDVQIFHKKTDAALLKLLMTETNINRYILNDRMKTDTVIIDCRDDALTDFYSMPVKYYKIGYDGLSITIDGNPRNTAVWGQANTYRFTPSFICPSQLAANLVVTDILTSKLDKEEARQLESEPDTITNNNAFDKLGRINKSVTFDVSQILETLYRNENQ
jgi:hypothetical protein